MSLDTNDRLDAPHRKALRHLATTLADRSVTWALTGSTSFALQGVPLRPNDIDVQTTAAGAYEIATCLTGDLLEPVSVSESEQIRSHFGALELYGIRVEIMGALQKRREDGSWMPPVDIEGRRIFVECGKLKFPVLPLGYEAEAYDQLGRTERATLLRKHAE